ncbi:ribonuclease P 40kDa subunit-domain-containing protein [Lipomyces tetrasporus]|uniref:Ribonuclease P 40kDa subunit-domain-containing protein n=1 Tax=Lipomyces tetrasporus TaxID=54092 RepID=A0AAD7QNV9_9ASCO|nr:ribonuclease P 40kDa subunit-domain-containing protein [Lipomyces tetrasporus]KAJ8098256.1 ribonuclease P 40kDa subunit-domain-containing protein [Lipomyces tetrasporus]
MSTSFSLSKREAASKVYVTQCATTPDVNKRPHTIITQHHYNQRADILIPTDAYESALSLSPILNGAKCTRDWRYYHATTALGSFLKPEFLNQHIKKDNCLVLSLAEIDTDDVYCIYDGVLRLSLRKDTYERVGLQGKASRFSKTRFIVEMNLRSPNFLPGHKGFDKLINATESSPLRHPIPFLICVFPSADFSSSLSPLPDFFKATAYPQQYTLTHIPNAVIVPPLSPFKSAIALTGPSYNSISRRDVGDYTDEVVREGLLHILEWTSLLGLESERIQFGRQIDPLLSTYSVFEDEGVEGIANPKIEKVTKISLDGFLTSRMTKHVFDELLKHLPPSSWAAITVYGFQDAPVSWASDEHSYLISGENDYTIVIKPEEPGDTARCILAFEVVGSNDSHN